MPDNPCKDCVCGNNGRPTGDCRELACSIIKCPEGQWAKPVPGKCCEFNCVNEGKTSNTRTNHLCIKLCACSVAFLCTLNFPLRATGCTPGEYYTLPDNPCKDCVCGSNGRPTGNCREIACSIPLCAEGQWAKHVPGTCCEFNCVEDQKTGGYKIHRHLRTQV